MFRTFLLASLAVVGAQAQKPALAVIEKASSHVGFFDPGGKLIKEVSVGTHPHEMALSGDGRFLFTSDNGVMVMTETTSGANTVSMIDVAKLQKIATIDLGRYRRPHGIDFDSATGRVFVTTELPSMLLVIDPAKRAVVDRYDVHGKTPHMIRTSPDHRSAWITCTDTSNVSVVDLKTRNVRTLPTGPRPQGIVFSPDGKRAYVANSDGETVTVVDVDRVRVIGEIVTGGAHSGPVRVAVSPDGKTILTALQLRPAIGFASADSLKEEKLIPLPGPPVSMTLSADGKLAYCSMLAQDTVFVISIGERRIVNTFKTPPQSGPDPVLALQ